MHSFFFLIFVKKLYPHRSTRQHILYYTILYYTILYYTILYYTILYYTILYYTILYYTIIYYNIHIMYPLAWPSSLGVVPPDSAAVVADGEVVIVGKGDIAVEPDKRSIRVGGGEGGQGGRTYSLHASAI